MITYDKLILVTRQTRLEELIARFNTRQQAAFYIEHSGGDFGFYEREHAVYQQAVSTLTRQLQRILKLQVIERSYLPNFLFAASDLVMTVGIDGQVVNTAKYLDGQPLLAVNPDPKHIDGVLLPFTVDSAAAGVRRLLAGEAPISPISMTEATLNDGQQLLAFNDFFIGRHDHVSARYGIEFSGRSETQSSSGILVSTGAGATGWLSSVFNMANGLLNTFSPEASPLSCPPLTWDTQQLIFVVREPFVSKTSQAGIVCGTITPDSPLTLTSHMPEGGVIFSDGVAADYLAFNAGTQATIQLAQKQTRLVQP